LYLNTNFHKNPLENEYFFAEGKCMEKHMTLNCPKY
jgi:hypothetical protein